MTDSPPPETSPGERTRRAVLGDAHVDRAQDQTTTFTADFQEFITRYAWGDVWSRPGLERHTRRLLTIAVLTALQNEHELVMHVRAALADDVTPEEIKEVLLHTAIYAGLPVANRAFALAGELIPDESRGGENQRASTLDSERG
ncbi:4-carboxymuconolactone decarboxylase [Phytoactinopolyspora mesophila]|uniref:4-carboxymuconolactone decarboxylase n=1 Tax=Phytoactinopolyspora mesophila TaxID=2650750 RepID=A0A7K3M0A7_9ACTN|nr:4-carboxymuconolactone decarboxylase [Phytoactinopolyspora mesophila]NDL56725.1 4-carboxymuconolactone decarboxylase [Phytoactinopolyspora mesophila]